MLVEDGLKISLDVALREDGVASVCSALTVVFV